MKKMILAILLICAIALTTGCNGASETESKAPDDQRVNESGPAYQMDLTLDTSNALFGKNFGKVELAGRIDITFTNTSSDAWTEVCLRDYADSIIAFQNLCGSSDTPEGISSVTDKSTGSALTFEPKASDASVIYVKLDKVLAPGERMTLSVDYKTPLPSSGARMGWFTSTDNKDITVNLGPFYPVLAVYENGKWNEAPYFLDGECFYAPCGSYDVTLKTDDGFTVISTGDETKNADGTWTLTARNVRDFAIIAGNHFAVCSEEVDGIKINSWYYDYSEGNRRYGETALKTAVDSVKAYTQAYGKYPYDTLDVVESCYDYGGLEYPTMVRISDLYGAELDLGDEGAGDSLRMSVAHEVAHQWFYGVVGNDQYAQAWLDESFAAYSECVYKAYTGTPETEICAEIEATEAECAEKFTDRYINLSFGDYSDEMQYVTAVYRAGKVFLYRLRETLGEEKFGEFMKQWYASHQFDIVTTEDFTEQLLSFCGEDANVKKLLDKYIGSQN